MLITPRYLRQQKELHRNARYGAASKKFAPLVAELIIEHDPRSILDYGAGKGALKQALGPLVKARKFAQYDPAVWRYSVLPHGTFDMVCCIDVLEHIEPKCLDDVLKSLLAKTRLLLAVTIHTGPAGKSLPDGRNAHLIQWPAEKWQGKLGQYFASVQLRQQTETTLFGVCLP
jgi:hypothetical protein